MPWRLTHSASIAGCQDRCYQQLNYVSNSQARSFYQNVANYQSYNWSLFVHWRGIKLRQPIPRLSKDLFSWLMGFKWVCALIFIYFFKFSFWSLANTLINEGFRVSIDFLIYYTCLKKMGYEKVA